MPKSPRRSAPQASVSVKAHATARAAATYERKVSVTKDIPTDVIRRQSNAFIDLISPITEWAGLRGDRLRHKRELLRIDQEATLYEISLNVRDILSISKLSPSIIPTKALIPMLEKASLEKLTDHDMIVAWANLIASSSIDFDSEVITFTSILASIGARERQILETLIFSMEDYSLQYEFRKYASKTGDLFLDRIIAASLDEALSRAITHGDLSIFLEVKSKIFLHVPLLFYKIRQEGFVDRETGEEIGQDGILYDKFYEENQMGFTILEYQGLIRSHQRSIDLFPYGKQNGFFTTFSWYELTELGYAFVKRIVRPEQRQREPPAIRKKPGS